MNRANEPADQLLNDPPDREPADQLLSDPPECGRPLWRTSSASDLVECVAVANLDGTIGVRNSRDPSGVTLILPREEFGRWVERIKAGDYDQLPHQKAAPGEATSEGRKPPQRRGDHCKPQE